MSVGGPVGFIGIIVPHLVRLMVGADHRVVLPASALFGAAFLVACDVVSRTVMAPLELPVGIITALIGGPFFLWLLVRRTVDREATMLRASLLARLIVATCACSARPSSRAACNARAVGWSPRWKQ